MIETQDLTIAQGVRRGLESTPKWLSPALLYDAAGSALFEAITELPVYGITRAELALMRRVGREIAERCQCRRIVELGCGDGRKARMLSAAFARGGGTLDYVGVDVSRYALDRFEHDLADLQHVNVSTIQASFLAPDEYLASQRHPLLVALLGSTLGNFDPPERLELLSDLRAELHPGDHLLLGLDLVKPEAVLMEAYDDPAGVTSAFDLNVLVRLNEELGANFPVRQFRHRAVWCPSKSRVEMHLQADAAFDVDIPAAECRVHFEPGETIHTESSYKFVRADVPKLAQQTGFTPAGEWTDPDWLFTLCLWRV